MPSTRRPLRIAWLIYRGNPHCGGQGVYTRYLAREITELGHHVEVLSGQPWPELDDAVAAGEGAQPRPLPPGQPVSGARGRGSSGTGSTSRSSPSCARPGSPSRTRSACGPGTCSQARRHDFDLIHDNQCLGTGLLGMMDDGWPVVATLHHPITVDRDLDMEHATSPWKRATLRRWYAFLEMQMKVAKQIPRLVTVSENSRRDIVSQMGVPEDRCTSCPSAWTSRPSARSRTWRASPAAS